MENVLDHFDDEKQEQPYVLATKTKRLVNTIVDGFAAQFLAWKIGDFLLGLGIVKLNMGTVRSLFLLQLVFSFFVLFAYYVLMEYHLKGKTIGKMLTKTRAVMANNEAMSLPTAVLRSFLRFVPFEPISFLISQRGWHDRWSKTKVIEDVNWEK